MHQQYQHVDRIGSPSSCWKLLDLFVHSLCLLFTELLYEAAGLITLKNCIKPYSENASVLFYKSRSLSVSM